MLLVCSKSTRKYFPEAKNVYIVQGPLSYEEAMRLKDTAADVVAVGGGAVIDAAKIICKNAITCFPTTASGASYTSHAVCWRGTEKISIKAIVPKEVHIKEEFLESLPETVVANTRYDAISHCLDSTWSVNSTKQSRHLCDQALEILKGEHTKSELIKAGNLAGKAIQISPTTILHSLSYPMTGIYSISHGQALGHLLGPVCEFMNFDLFPYTKNLYVPIPDIDKHLVATEALKYKKIFDINKKISHNIIMKILKNRGKGVAYDI